MKSTTLFQRITIATILLSILFTSVPAVAANDADPNAETSFVLNQFRTRTLEDCVKLMNRRRPQAVTPEEKFILRKDGFELVTAETEVTDPDQLGDLYRQTQEVLRFHRRAGIVEYILFRHRDPILITKAGAFIAIASRALEIADNKEAKSGIIAHELSHEYFALEKYEALKSRDCKKLRVIELLCDAFATVTLISLKMDPDKYADALKKIIRNSRESEQLNDGNNGMPSLEARLQVISEIKKLYSH